MFLRLSGRTQFYGGVVINRPLLFVVLLVLGFAAIAQQSQSQSEKKQSTAPSHPAAQAGPAKPTPESMAKAKKMYGFDCAMCHGENGDGKGELAADLKVKPKDYTDPASLKDSTDQQLFDIIQSGKGEMPPEGKRAKPDEIWALVSYIRSFAKK